MGMTRALGGPRPAPSAPPSTSLSLPPHVHAVTIGEDLVFLDVQADAYLCLVGAGQAVGLSSDGAVRPVDPGAGEVLLEAGLAHQKPPSARRQPPAKPIADLPASNRAARPSEIAAAARACVATAAAFRFKPFSALVESAMTSRAFPIHEPSSIEAVIEAAAVFARLRPWSPVGGRCLMRSHLQLQYLRGLGLAADWVIGVRTWPFMAHCWLQAGPVALDEDVERLVAYTPIMVI